MSSPRFTAENSLYKTTGHYCTATAPPQARLAIPQEFLPLGSLGIRPTPAFVSCFPCHLDETGACVQDCTRCLPGHVDGCQDFTQACAPSECCPPGRDACFAAHKPQFCCPPGLSCCHPETNLCCREQCCFDHCCAATENCCTLPGAPVGCCPAGQDCTFEGCCPIGQGCNNHCCAPGQTCCNGVCTTVGTNLNCRGCGDVCPPGTTCCNGVCVNTNTDSNNCGRCGRPCPPGPLNSSPVCINGNCDFTCNPGFGKCGGACCPNVCCNGVCCPTGRGCCNGVCTLLGTNQNCRRCNDTCIGGRTCVSGRCTCPPMRVDCGTAGCCPVGQMCVNGNCVPPPPDCHRLHRGDSCAPPPGCRVCIPCGLSCNDNGPLSQCCVSNDGLFGHCCAPGQGCDDGYCV